MTEREHLAMASVPAQSWGELYDPKQALKTGTIFKDLNLPFFAAEDLAIPVVPARGSREGSEAEGAGGAAWKNSGGQLLPG